MDNAITSNGAVGLRKDDQVVFRDEILTGYTDFKGKLDTELKANAEGFVRIGYLLKVARDTNILSESGYKNVAEFAFAEYQLTKDIVSRYIAINDKYAENGYSDKLQSRYEGFGVAKLQEMLTLPDYIIDEITPTLTRAEIQKIKAEVKAENETTPIEVAIEAAAPEVQKEEKELTFSMRVWKQYFSADTSELEKEKFLRLSCQFYKSILTDDTEVKTAKEKFFDVFGGRIVWARIPGVGRIMISVSDEAEDKIVYINSRTGEKQELKSIDALNDIKELIEGRGCTSDVFDELFREKKEEPKPEEPKAEEPKAEESKPAEPEKEKVAPVQQAAEDIMPKPGSWTYDQSETKSVQPELENQPEVKSVQTEVNKTQGDNDDEKECSKETADNRSESDEDREISESTECDGHETPDAQGDREESSGRTENGNNGDRVKSDEVAPVQQSDDIESENDNSKPKNGDKKPKNGDKKPKNGDKKPKQLGHLEVGDKIINLKDGTRGTMLGYCAGEYKISTENGMTLVSESSINWKKEEIADTEYREAEHTAAGQEEPAGSEPKEIPDLVGRSVKIDNILDQMTDAYTDDPKISDATLRFLVDKARELIEKAEEIIKLRDELNREALDTEA